MTNSLFLKYLNDNGFTKRTNTYVSDKFSLSYFIYPNYAVDQRVIWSSSNNAIADVNSEGYVTAKAAGEVIITATAVDGGYSAKWTLNIEDKYCEVKRKIKDKINEESQKILQKISQLIRYNTEQIISDLLCCFLFI